MNGEISFSCSFHFLTVHGMDNGNKFLQKDKAFFALVFEFFNGFSYVFRAAIEPNNTVEILDRFKFFFFRANFI